MADPAAGAAADADPVRLAELVAALSLAAEPGGPTPLSGEQLDQACQAAADFADLKSPWLLGHSRAVAELAEAAAWRAGLPAASVPFGTDQGLPLAVQIIAPPGRGADRAGAGRADRAAPPLAADRRPPAARGCRAVTMIRCGTARSARPTAAA